MVRRASTIKLGTNKGEYAQVSERVKEFREACPNGKIITKRIEVEGNADKELTFRTYVWKDRKNYITNDLLSCDASAEASMVVKIGKDKEKLETISVGRALAMLGYLASGQIASSEEMEEFYKEKDQKAAQEVVEHKERVIDDIRAAIDIEQLRQIYSKSGLTNDPDVVKAKDDMKEKLTAKPTPGQSKRHDEAKERGDKAREEANKK